MIVRPPMYLGEVRGSVVCERKIEALEGVTLKLVQPLDEDQKPDGNLQVAVDVVGGRNGDLVYLVGSREAALALEETFVPVDAAIVGLVDDLHRSAS